MLAADGDGRNLVNAISGKLPNCRVSFREGHLLTLQIEELLGRHNARGGEVPSICVLRPQQNQRVSQPSRSFTPDLLMQALHLPREKVRVATCA